MYQEWPLSHFVKNMVTKMVQCEAMDETPIHSSNLWVRSNTFMQVLAEKAVNNLSFITPVAAFVTRRVINAEREKVSRAPRVTKEAS